MKGREHVNRKRQHQSTETRSEGLDTDNSQGAKKTDGGEMLFVVADASS